MNTLIIDNYDSFTYNIVHILKELNQEFKVVRNDKLELNEVIEYDKIIISPGPGIPLNAGKTIEVIKRYASTKSILGVCLGHQAIAEAFGGKIKNTSNYYHGVSSKVYKSNRDYLLNGLELCFDAARYHSWIVVEGDLPDCLETTAKSEDDIIMAIRHKEYDVRGIQFHPESILTPNGKIIIKNFLEN